MPLVGVPEYIQGIERGLDLFRFDRIQNDASKEVRTAEQQCLEIVNESDIVLRFPVERLPGLSYGVLILGTLGDDIDGLV